MTPMTPYYRGFKGTITSEDDEGLSFKTTGIYQESGQKVIITELPVGMWTQQYKEHLEKLQNDDFIRYYNSYCTDVDVNFEVFSGEN